MVVLVLGSTPSLSNYHQPAQQSRKEDGTGPVDCLVGVQEVALVASEWYRSVRMVDQNADVTSWNGDSIL